MEYKGKVKCKGNTTETNVFEQIQRKTKEKPRVWSKIQRENQGKATCFFSKIQRETQRGNKVLITMQRKCKGKAMGFSKIQRK